MKKMMKIGSVIAGFILAFAGASLAAYWNDLRTAKFLDQSPGMVAGGEMMIFIGVFAFLSIFPIGLALFYLRSEERFWEPFSLFAIGLAVTGPMAEFLMIVIKAFRIFPHSWWAMVIFIAMLRVFGTVVMDLGFILSAYITPLPRPRRRLLIAVKIETALILFLAAHFLVLRGIY